MRMRDLLQGTAKDGLRRGAAIVCYAIIAVLSSVPGDLRPHVPGFSDKMEHLVGFLALGAVTAFAASRALSWFRITLMVIAYAGVLELGQIFIPGRVASLADFAASSVGAILGVTLALWLRPRLRFP